MAPLPFFVFLGVCLEASVAHYAGKGGNSMKKNVKYAVTGALAMFTKWLGLEQKRAFATSVAVILPLSAVSLVIYFFRGGVDFLYALPFLLGGLAGGVISGRIFKKMPVTLLRRAFGLLILYGGIRAVLLL